MFKHKSMRPDATPIDTTRQALSTGEGRTLKKKLPLAVLISG